jgi:predicted permease
LARALLAAVLHRADRECALSDLGEEFEMRSARDGRGRARRWYRWQALMSVIPSLRRRWTAARTIERGGMSMRGMPAFPGPSLRSELRWAWRGIRARGWRAAFVVSLFAVALAANAIVFAAADAFVFRTLPYHEPDRLVLFERVDSRTSDYIWPQALREWRNHTDLFTGVHAHALGGTAYITIGGATEVVRSEAITPGLLELLGVVPAWGRPFTPADAVPDAPPVAIVGESLARELFGDPAAAVGQAFSTGRRPLTIVGVMAASFRFPAAREQFWVPLDLAAWPNNSGIRHVARLAPTQTLDGAIRAVETRRDAVARVVERPIKGESMRLRAMADVRANPAAASLFGMLVGAAACLLLIACANVASLELAAAARRVRDHAVQTALGASRASLVRSGLLEGAALLAASAALAIALTAWGITALDAQLTTTMRAALTNPLDVDTRALVFMVVVATATWLLTALPSIWRLSRLSVVDGLRDDARTMPVTRGGARSRQILVASQVALTTLLLVGATSYLRSYVTQVGLDKGFDATNVATVEVFPAPDAPRRTADLESAILDRLRVLPWVRKVAVTDSLPPSTQAGIMAPLTVEGRDETVERIHIHFASVDPEYFSTMSIAIVEGQRFDETTALDQVVVDERFARRYWPQASPIGARFWLGKAGIGGVSRFQIAGVSRQFRPDRLINDAAEEVYVAHIRRGPDYHPRTFVARLDDEARVGDLTAIVRSIADRSVVRVDTIDARYARLHADTRLAATVTSGFGGVALLVATAGIYAVMAFIVSGRAREIAIRMALGADRRGVRGMVLRSSLGSVAVGGAIGIAGAVAVSLWSSTQFPAVRSTDPLTYAGVSALLVATALVATWWPARRASRVDPAVTLRGE